MSDRDELATETLAEWREQYREPIDPLDVDAWHTEMEGIRRDVVLPLIDEVENLRRWKNEAVTVLAEWREKAEHDRQVRRDLAKEIAEAEVIYLRAKLRDMEIERNMLRITTEALTAKVARAENLADEWDAAEAEWGHMFEPALGGDQCARDLRAALADEGGDDANDAP